MYPNVVSNCKKPCHEKFLNSNNIHGPWTEWVSKKTSNFITGQEAVVVKNGSRLCGTGAARSSTPILQNKAYWEFKLQQAGVWSCGLANPGCDLNKDLGNDLNSWALTHENVVMVNGNVEQKLSQKISEGDIIVSDYFQVYKRYSPFIIKAVFCTVFHRFL